MPTPRPLRQHLLAAALAGSFGPLATLIALPAAAQAPAAATAIDIPAQPLASALTALARQTGTQVFAAGDLVANRSAPAVAGRLTPQQALDRLLAGSGLVGASEGGALVLRRAAAVPSAAQSQSLAEVKVTAAASSGPVTERSNSYTAPALTIGRSAASLRETPQSVTVITRQQIEDRNFATLDDAMATTTGITSSTANFNRVSYAARGFTLTDNMVDGLPSIANAYAGYVPDLAFFDRVEVLRGAGGLIYGAGSPGGAVNLVRKRPTREAQFSVNAIGGSFATRRLELDASGPLNASGSLRGRAVLVRDERETFIDYEYSKKTPMYGILELDIAPGTTAHVGASYEKYDGNYAPYGLPRYSDGRSLDLPRSSRGFAPSWNNYYTEVKTGFAGIDHRFNDRWTGRVVLTQQSRHQGGLTVNTTGAVNPVTLRGPVFPSNGVVQDSDSPTNSTVVDGMVNGAFDAFGRTHELVFGGSWGRSETDPGWTATGTIAQPTTSIFAADPTAIARPVLGPRVAGTSESSVRQNGVFGVARLRIASPLTLVLGGRLSANDSTSRNTATGAVTRAREKDVFTPYGGVLYDLNDQWTAYASYADIYRVQNTSFTASGAPLKPVVGANYEAGIKGELYGGRLNTSFAIFRVEEEGRSQVDPANPAPCAASPTRGDCFVAEGKVRGQGFEVDATGEPAPGWQLSGGYTYLNTRYIRDRAANGAPSSLEGTSFNTITPRHLLRVWTNYRLPGEWNAWQVGGGLATQSENYRVAGTTRLTQAGFTLLSLRLGYRINEHWQAGINVNNLFDKTYYQQVGTLVSTNRYGEPRSVMLSLRGRF